MLAKIENDYREMWFKTVTNRSDTNWHCIGDNPLITLDFVLEKLDFPWKWSVLSRNKNMTMEMIIAHPELPWDWFAISWWNPNVTPEFVVSHPELPWSWHNISHRLRLYILYKSIYYYINLYNII